MLTAEELMCNWCFWNGGNDLDNQEYEKLQHEAFKGLLKMSIMNNTRLTTM